MKFFNRQKAEDIMIIGCGRLGSVLAYNISNQNKNVAVIDMDGSSFKKLPPSYRGSIIEGDGTDTDMLELAGIKYADTLIAVTNDDDINIMIAQIAKQRYKVKNVVVSVDDPSKDILYHEMNILSICPTKLSVNEVERVLINAGEEKAV